jgi:2,3-dihydroxybenzoate-AMP ligase
VFVPLVAAEEATDVIVTLHFAAMLVEDSQMRQAFRSVKRLNFSGTQLPESIARTLTGAGFHIVQLFGMGEGLFLITPAGAPAALRHHTVGVPLSPLDEVRIHEPGTETETPAGRDGELCCRGPYTIRGYYDAPVRNREAFTEDGFYRTGDIARAREIDGIKCYSIEGRIKDLINRGGEKVNAEEVELALVKHLSVREVAVVAMPDPRLGERTCAYIAVGSGADAPTLDDFKHFLESSGLAKYKWPERVEIVDALPRTPVGKLNKQALRQDIVAKLKADQMIRLYPI